MNWFNAPHNVSILANWSKPYVTKCIHCYDNKTFRTRNMKQFFVCSLLNRSAMKKKEMLLCWIRSVNVPVSVNIVCVLCIYDASRGKTSALESRSVSIDFLVEIRRNDKHKSSPLLWLLVSGTRQKIKTLEWNHQTEQILWIAA